jgi:hypothetical protein
MAVITGGDQDDVTMPAVFLPQECYQISLVRQQPIVNADAPCNFLLQEGSAAKQPERHCDHQVQPIAFQKREQRLRQEIRADQGTVKVNTQHRSTRLAGSGVRRVLARVHVAMLCRLGHG